MFEFKISELKVDDEFTLTGGVTWWRVMSIVSVENIADKDACIVTASRLEPCCSEKKIRHFVTKKNVKIIVRQCNSPLI